MQYAARDFGDIIDPVLLYSLQVGKRSRFEQGFGQTLRI
jgi:hypothetical protein